MLPYYCQLLLTVISALSALPAGIHQTAVSAIWGSMAHTSFWQMFSYFFGKEKAVGITVGATAYPQFLVLDDYRDTPFAIAAMGYAALSFRYPAPVTGLALPALAYIIY